MSTESDLRQYPLVPLAQVFAKQRRGTSPAKLKLGKVAWWRKAGADPEKVICIRDIDDSRLGYTPLEIYQVRKREVTQKLRERFAHSASSGQAWRQIRAERRGNTILMTV